jgi:ribonuclease Z
MKPTFQMQLVNGPWGDPALYVRIRWARRALLFDLGSVVSLPSGDLLRVGEVFVSHTHLDHFVGFDHLLRTVLGRDRALSVFGPPGIIDNVEGKLRGYTWNLVQGYPLSLEVFEVDLDCIRGARFACAEAFRRCDLTPRPFTGDLWDEPGFRVRATHLDHRIPCLAFAVEEPFHINVNKERLAELRLPVGPWLSGLKAQIRGGAAAGTGIVVRWPDGRTETFTLGDLKDALINITPGQKLAYVTDVLYSPENVARIVTLAKAADVLYCEAAYLDRDEPLAGERCHLTAKQAGLIAREAGVRRLALFHFSPRYQGETEAFYREAREAFGGWVTVPKGHWN